VLAVAPAVSDVARLVRESGCGICVEPEDADGIVQMVRGLRNRPEKLQEMGGRALELSRSFHRETELRRFVEIVKDAGRPV
jgi:glycosyltransferase involved in cell wall biosynthesis